MYLPFFGSGLYVPLPPPPKKKGKKKEEEEEEEEKKINITSKQN